MPKPQPETGQKNLIASRLKELRALHGLFQRDLACLSQLSGVDMGKNVLTRIDTNKGYVADFELEVSEIFEVSYGYLMDGAKRKRRNNWIPTCRLFLRGEASGA